MIGHELWVFNKRKQDWFRGHIEDITYNDVDGELLVVRYEISGHFYKKRCARIDEELSERPKEGYFSTWTGKPVNQKNAFSIEELNEI